VGWSYWNGLEEDLGPNEPVQPLGLGDINLPMEYFTQLLQKTNMIEGRRAFVKVDQ
jgi:hypothetical protein